ncbi:hypothetical protein BS78_03G120600 [Paspalum vaginatum]|nr:hypothetical protein BS78_03G120600 [Paspalum vaginatum]
MAWSTGNGPPARTRGRSRERHSPGRQGRPRRSPPRHLRARRATPPEGHLRCNPGDSAGPEDDHRPSPHPPLFRTVVQAGGDAGHRDVQPLSTQIVIHEPGLTSFSAARRYLPGCVYRRCSRSAPPADNSTTPECSPGRSASPGAALHDVAALVVEPFGSSATDPRRSGVEQEGPPTPLHSDAAALPSTFIDSFTRPAAQPLLAVQQQGPSKQKKLKKRLALPTRRSKRLAAIAWPCGNIQDRARQVLMKRLGVLQETEKPSEAALQHLLDLFKGPLTVLVMHALSALCGIQAPQGQAALEA